MMLRGICSMRTSSLTKSSCTYMIMSVLPSLDWLSLEEPAAISPPWALRSMPSTRMFSCSPSRPSGVFSSWLMVRLLPPSGRMAFKITATVPAKISATASTVPSRIFHHRPFFLPLPFLPLPFPPSPAPPFLPLPGPLGGWPPAETPPLRPARLPAAPSMRMPPPVRDDACAAALAASGRDAAACCGCAAPACCTGRAWAAGCVRWMVRPVVFWAVPARWICRGADACCAGAACRGAVLTVRGWLCAGRAACCRPAAWAARRRWRSANSASLLTS